MKHPGGDGLGLLAAEAQNANAAATGGGGNGGDGIVQTHVLYTPSSRDEPVVVHLSVAFGETRFARNGMSHQPDHKINA